MKDFHSSRRGFLLRGVLGGGAVSIGLPLLDVLLDGNGKAYAAELGGAPIPVRFGTWFWGCGSIPDRWDPQTTGAHYDLPPELAPIAALREHISVLSGFSVPLDGRGNSPHLSGNIGLRTGSVADAWTQISAPSLDVLVADAIGSGSFFRSLDLTADGNPRTSYSFRDAGSMNASMPSALEVYQRIFGGGFNDPNAAAFTPDPRIMVRESVLSGVGEQRRKLLKRVGSSDRARLEQYFQSLREVEQKLAMQLQKPPPALACSVPAAPAPLATGTDVEQRLAMHSAMSELLAMALACNQTRVFNMVFSAAASDLRRAGSTTGHHQSTHEELVDRKLGFQPTTEYFSLRSMEAWANFVSTLAAVREGDGCLLDNCLVLAHSEVSYAKTHDLNGIPMMIAGRAGGAIRSGIHVRGGGEPTTRVGLTIQQALGMPVQSWGSKSMEATRVVTELLT